MSNDNRELSARDKRRGWITLRATLIVVCAAFLAHNSRAHPSVSVVVDSSGTIYYSDLSRVWMITPDGTRSIAVNNVHTHELWIGPDGNVWGDDVQNVGEQYRHRVWKRLPDGSLTNELPWRDGHPTEYYDYSFDRDARGFMYVLRRDNVTIEVRDPNPSSAATNGRGRVVRTIPLDRSLGYPHWLTTRPDGTVFVTVGSTLLRVEPGSTEAKVVASDLVKRSAAFADLHDRHAIMGLWTAPDIFEARPSDAEAAAVYVSDFAGQAVRRVAADGTVSTVWQGDDNWSVTGGTVLQDGSMLILAWSTSNDVQIRHIAPDGSSCVFE